MEAYPKVYRYRRLVQAKLFIDEHYAEALDLSSIADEAFFSKFHFIRLFKEAYGRTPHQYLVFTRLQAARDFLKTDRTIADICYSVGFDSVSSFTGLFKRHTGQTPGAYREAWLARQADMLGKPLAYVPHCFASAWGWVARPA